MYLPIITFLIHSVVIIVVIIHKTFPLTREGQVILSQKKVINYFPRHYLFLIHFFSADSWTAQRGVCYQLTCVAPARLRPTGWDVSEMAGGGGGGGGGGSEATSVCPHTDICRGHTRPCHVLSRATSHSPVCH